MRRKFNARVRKRFSWGYAGRYKGFWCDSSWELAYIVYNLEHDIPVIRNRKGFKYTFYKKVHKFYPDFIVNGKYVEIKGVIKRKSNAKFNQFPEELIIIGPEEIKPYLEYTIQKYGVDFYKTLYDKKV
jgi:hypothetical protein